MLHVGTLWVYFTLSCTLMVLSSPKWGRLPHAMADCSAPCWPIRLKFYMVGGLGYGHKWFEFRWDASRYVSAAVEKPPKTNDFCCFWPRLTDDAADCPSPCKPIWLKFYVVDGLGCGHKQFEFCWVASRYVSAAVEKPSKKPMIFAVFGPGERRKEWN